MSEIAIISTREVIYEPSLQKSGKIKVTSNASQNAGMWNLKIRFFGTHPKTDTREVQVQIGVNEETNEPIYETQTEYYTYDQVDFISDEMIVKSDQEMNKIIDDVDSSITKFSERFYEGNRNFLLNYISSKFLNPEEQDDTKKVCVFGLKPNEFEMLISA